MAGNGPKPGLGAGDRRHIMRDEDSDPKCFCSHRRSSHEDERGQCEAFINEFMGDCPCMRFEEAF